MRKSYDSVISPYNKVGPQAAICRFTSGFTFQPQMRYPVITTDDITVGSASTSMEFSIFYGNFSVKWKFLWNRDKCGNSTENWK